MYVTTQTVKKSNQMWSCVGYVFELLWNLSDASHNLLVINIDIYFFRYSMINSRSVMHYSGSLVVSLSLIFANFLQSLLFESPVVGWNIFEVFSHNFLHLYWTFPDFYYLIVWKYNLYSWESRGLVYAILIQILTWMWLSCPWSHICCLEGFPCYY